MLLSFSMNPLTLVRWLFFGKALSEIVADFEKKKNELESFFVRTERQVTRKVSQIAILQAQNDVHSADMDKARMIADNLKTLMSTALVVPQSEPAQDDTGSA